MKRDSFTAPTCIKCWSSPHGSKLTGFYSHHGPIDLHFVASDALYWVPIGTPIERKFKVGVMSMSGVMFAIAISQY